MLDSFSYLYLPTAVGLGALHALEPGHSKTMIAAYLIGTKGTKSDALLLGLAAATTHSLLVIGLSVAALYLGREAFADQAMHWLQVSSGVVVIALGLWMLWRRWPRRQAHAPHHHAPNPVAVASAFAPGEVSIVDTPDGERMRYVCAQAPADLIISVRIDRDGGAVEVLELRPKASAIGEFLSTSVPAEPHEFTATVVMSVGGKDERHPFAMHEPEGHGEHDDLDDDAHARAHAAAMPAYVATGGRPTALQVIAFGAAGGMIPCPASITVMLLALSVGQVSWGIAAVLCFSLGLAVALVGIGMLVVIGASKMASSGRFAWVSARAPMASALLVITTGVVALLFVH